MGTYCINIIVSFDIFFFYVEFQNVVTTSRVVRMFPERYKFRRNMQTEKWACWDDRYIVWEDLPWSSFYLFYNLPLVSRDPEGHGARGCAAPYVPFLSGCLKSTFECTMHARMHRTISVVKSVSQWTVLDSGRGDGGTVLPVVT